MGILEKLRLAVDNDSTAPDWVVLDLHGSYPAYQAADPVQSLLRRGESLEGLTGRLEKLAGTDWVRGVLVRVGKLDAGLTTAHAIGRAVGRLAESKRVVGYVPQVNMRTLLVTASLTEVVAPESAEVRLPGFAAEQVFYGAFLTKHGITFENLRIGEYKAALTRFSEKGMDEHNREQLTAYVDSAERSWTGHVTEGKEGADGVLEAGLTSADQLLERGLISRIGYDDEICTLVEHRWTRTVELLLPRGLGRKARQAEHIAVVPVTGPIVTGRSRGTPPVPFLPGAQTGSETVVAALRKADRDEDVKAILLYVDSGGGSALASDVIGRAVASCTTPVVAVMGSVAASGGYYVLTAADHVVADPYTLTGSIGVVVGKPVLSGFDGRHGFKPEAVGREGALFESPHRPFSDDDRAWAERMMDEVYGRFVDRVAAGRGLTTERVDEIGRGRIWSGADAHELGLVDELGDLDTGIAAARRLGDLPEDAAAKPLSHGLQLPGAPSFGKDPASALAGLWPFGSETVLTWFDRSVTIR
ncbi:S49 family peptidase [Georgenia halophila]